MGYLPQGRAQINHCDVKQRQKAVAYQNKNLLADPSHDPSRHNNTVQLGQQRKLKPGLDGRSLNRLPLSSLCAGLCSLSGINLGGEKRSRGQHHETTLGASGVCGLLSKNKQRLQRNVVLACRACGNCIAQGLAEKIPVHTSRARGSPRHQAQGSLASLEASRRTNLVPGWPEPIPTARTTAV